MSYKTDATQKTFDFDYLRIVMLSFAHKVFKKALRYRLFSLILFAIVIVFMVVSLMTFMENPSVIEDFTALDTYDPDAFSYDMRSNDTFKLADKNIHNKSGMLILAFGNIGMFHMSTNWILSLGRNQIDKFLILGFDAEIVGEIVLMGFANNVALVPQSWLIAPVPMRFSFGSTGHANMMRSRTAIINRFIDRGYTVFHTDLDTVWLNPNIFDYIKSTDTKDSEIIYMADKQDNINLGCIIYKPKPKCKLFLHKLMKFEEKYADDSAALSVLKEDLNLKQSVFRPLEKSLFTSGANTHAQAMHMGLRPIMFHASNAIGQDDKVTTFRSFGLWYPDQL